MVVASIATTSFALGTYRRLREWHARAHYRGAHRWAEVPGHTSIGERMGSLRHALVSALLLGACDGNPRSECIVDGECGIGQSCAQGQCSIASTASCSWSLAGDWTAVAVAEWDERLRSVSASMGPDNELAFCVQSREGEGTDATDHIRIGIGRPGGVETLDLLDDGAQHRAACMDVGFDGSTRYWLVALDGAVVLVSAVGPVEGGSLTREVVTQGGDVASLGSIDQRTRGSLGIVPGAGVTSMLVSLGFGPNVFYERSDSRLRLAWRGWKPSQHLTGAPSFLLVDGAGGGTGFATSLPSPSGIRLAGIYRGTGKPASVWSPAPFVVDATASRGRTLLAKVIASGTSDLLVASGRPGTAKLLHARKESGAWKESTVLDPYEAPSGSERAVAANLVRLRDGETAAFFASQEDGASVLRAAKSGTSGWDTARVALVRGGKVLAPTGLVVGCGKPAVYFWERFEHDGRHVVALSYRESAAAGASSR